MAKETIIKALQRTKDENGVLHPVFPVTSVDAVYWDIENQQTLEDKLIGGVINNGSVVYNNIYSKSANNEQTGILKLELPIGKDNVDITAELDVSAMLTREHREVTTFVSDGLYTDNRYKRPTIIEPSPDGEFLFIAAEYTGDNSPAPPRLYKNGLGAGINIPIDIGNIYRIKRVRFSKTSSTLFVLGTTAASPNTSPIMMVYSVSRINNTATELFRTTYTNEDPDKIFFDTMMINDSEYFVRSKKNGVVGTGAFLGYTYNASGFTSTDLIGSPITSDVPGEIRISPDSMFMSVLSADASQLIVLRNNNGRFHSKDPNRSTFDYSSSYGGTGSGAWTKGRWSNVNFDSTSRKIYGIYTYRPNTIEYRTMRMCQITGDYGEKSSNDKEIIFTSTESTFPIGEAYAIRPVPYAPSFNNTNASNGFDCVYIGTGGVSGTYGVYPPLVRMKGMTISVDTGASTSYGSGADAITDTTPVMRSGSYSIAWPTASARNMTNIVDMCIHNTSGYGLAVVNTFSECPIIPIALTSTNPVPIYTINPTYTSIEWDSGVTAISHDGSAIAHVDVGGYNIYVSIRNSSGIYGNRVINNNVPNNTIRGLTVIKGGEIVVAYNDNAENAFTIYRYNGTSYVDITPTSTVTVPQLKSGTIESSDVTINNGIYTWTTVIAATSEFGSSAPVTSFTAVEFRYNGTEVTVSGKGQLTDQNITKLYGMALSADGNKLAVLGKVAGVSTYIYGIELSSDSMTTRIREDITSLDAKITNNAHIALNDSGSLLALSISGSLMDVRRLKWSGPELSNKVTKVNVTYPTTNAANNIFYAPRAKRFFAYTFSNGIYIYEDNELTLTLVDRIDVSYIRSTSHTASVASDGTVLTAYREYRDYTSIINVATTKTSGRVVVSGKLTSDGWRNVDVQSSIPNLRANTRLAYDAAKNKAVILIGSTSNVWYPLYLNIDRIIISGVGARRESYKTGYDATIIQSTSSLIHTTVASEYALTDEYIKRTRMKSYNIARSAWSDERASTGFYVYRIYNDNITIDSNVNVEINDLDSMSVANTAGVLGLAVEFMGYVEIYAPTRPTGNIIANVDIFN